MRKEEEGGEEKKARDTIAMMIRKQTLDLEDLLHENTLYYDCDRARGGRIVSLFLRNNNISVASVIIRRKAGRTSTQISSCTTAE